MPYSRSILIAALVLASGTALAGPPGGRGMGPPPGVMPIGRAHESQPEDRSLADSVRRVERATGGEILSAERVPFDGRDINRIKVLDQTGRVRVITEDPHPQSRPPRQ
ncbi:hypothetical protein [Cognatilysobacter terrigena]|uniref:hypothetical protein n=1 Tax=Cognatilysobacter terrigena TaxID=2488749 RepID=UPI00105C14D2|nr:hypothetical protein [Lysobacter terrigena]